MKCACRLYSDVITSIAGYGGMLWTEVVANLDTMAERMLTFQLTAKRMPKALSKWQAYLDCKLIIDTFLAELPVYQQLAHKAMRPRCCLAFELVKRLPHDIHIQFLPHLQALEGGDGDCRATAEPGRGLVPASAPVECWPPAARA